MNKRISVKLLLVVLIMTGALQSCSITVFTHGVRDPQVTEGLKVSPAQGQDYDLVTLKGPGTFLSATISKQGGDSDLTFVSLKIDGRNVMNVSILAVKRDGVVPNSLLSVVEQGGNEKLYIGLPTPLYYENELTLSVHVQENGVAQILANVIHGK